MPNLAIELHDSRVTGIRTEGSDVVLDLDAYVHLSDGEPGVDAGTGWTRPIRITVRDGWSGATSTARPWGSPTGPYASVRACSIT